MKIGVITFVTDDTLPPAELARAAEDRGFESLFVTEHTHIPESRYTRYPRGGPLPRHYYRTLDPFVALAAASTATTRLRLGTGVVLIVQRDPIVLAKEVASLDHISGGRVTLGVGAGWNKEEMRNHGTEPGTRMRLMRERVLAIREIWQQERAEFHGEFVDLDPLFSWPKPWQQPSPPILLGGDGPTVTDRVLDYADGWIPLFNGKSTTRRIADFRAKALTRGRRITVTVCGVPPEPEHLEALAEAGADEVLLHLRPRSGTQMLRQLDRFSIVAGL